MTFLLSPMEKKTLELNLLKGSLIFDLISFFRCVPDSDLTNRLQQKMKPAVFPGWGVNYAGPEG
jgi:hypothetical protein